MRVADFMALIELLAELTPHEHPRIPGQGAPFVIYGVPIPAGGVAYTEAEAVEVAKRLGGAAWVVKAQIHAGGRGKAGGVKLVKSEAEVAEAAKSLLGKRLVTHQTGPEGRDVKRVPSMSRPPAISPASFISHFRSIAAAAGSRCIAAPAKAGRRSKSWRRARRKRSLHLQDPIRPPGCRHSTAGASPSNWVSTRRRPARWSISRPPSTARLHRARRRPRRDQPRWS